MIKVSNLTKKYGIKTVLDDVSFEVNDGEIVGFLGPNGAGKSTTMNIITGYLSSGEGEVTIDGLSILEDPIEAKTKIGYLPELPPLYKDMTVVDYLSFIYDLKKSKLNRSEHIKRVCALAKIENVSHRVIKHLSKGYQQRVGLAGALIGNPKHLILDEPTVGLDPQQIIEIRTLIKSLGKNHTIILSSHILPEIQAICDRIVIIAGGKIVANGTHSEISKAVTGQNTSYTFRVSGDSKKVIDTIDDVAGVEQVEQVADAFNQLPAGTADYVVRFSGELDARDVVAKYLVSAGFGLSLIESNELTLEDIFIKLTENPELGAELLKEANKTAPAEEETPVGARLGAPAENADEPTGGASPAPTIVPLSQPNSQNKTEEN